MSLSHQTHFDMGDQSIMSVWCGTCPLLSPQKTSALFSPAGWALEAGTMEGKQCQPWLFTRFPGLFILAFLSPTMALLEVCVAAQAMV